MITEIYDFLLALFAPIGYLLNPHKRIFALYLFSSVLVAVFAWRLAGVQKAGLRRFLLRGMFSPALWFTRSSWVDLQWTLLNHSLRALVLVPLIGGQMALALKVNRWLISVFGDGNFIHWSAPTTAIIFTASIFIFEDFSRFIVHFFYHKIPWLWRFHAIHHSAPTLTPLTLYRVHSVEMVINSLRSLAIVGSVSGVFMYTVDGRIGMVSILGASIFNIVFNLVGANLRHSHVWLGFGRFEKWFISPAQHQIHHSAAPRHYDKNFGASLAVWDKIFGSWLGSKGERVSGFGVGEENPGHQSFLRQWKGIQ
ncbi:MAG: sterol desaturase [Alteromonadaceae bacterium]|nr:MAG: sterol desaturase [Alteromonadaceae bacterium]